MKNLDAEGDMEILERRKKRTRKPSRWGEFGGVGVKKKSRDRIYGECLVSGVKTEEAVRNGVCLVGRVNKAS